MTVTGVVGVTPIACGRPIPKSEAVAAAMVIVISNILALSVAVVRISSPAAPEPTPEVLLLIA
jgi:hypothetical protein